MVTHGFYRLTRRETTMNAVWASGTDLHREGLILASTRLGKLLDEIENFGRLPDKL